MFERSAFARRLRNLTTLCSTQAIKHIQKERPALASRLPKIPEPETEYGPLAKMDCSPAEQLFGIKFQTWPSVLERTIDALVEVEKGF